MRVAGILRASLINGDGVRFVVFVQGCAHRCRGCQNPGTWDLQGGFDVSVDDLVAQYRAVAHLVDGVTLSGGDPFYGENQQHCMELLEALGPDVNVWIYTGYLYEEVQGTPLAQRADVIVDGPYVEELRCVPGISGDGKMYGSKNQRIIRKKT